MWGKGPVLPSGAPGHPAHTALAHGLVSPSLPEHKNLVTADTHANRRGCHAPRGCTNMQDSQQLTGEGTPAPVLAGPAYTRLG